MREALDIKNIDRLPRPAKRQEIPEGIILGLYLVVQPTGQKSWAFRYSKFGGGKITIGRYPDCSHTTARAAAVKYAADLEAGINIGADQRTPKVAEAVATAQVAGAKLFKDAWAEYIETYCKVQNRPSTVATKEGFYRNHFQGLADRLLSSITRSELFELIAGIAAAGSPVAANRALPVLSTFFKWCVPQDLIPATPTTLLVKPTAESIRTRKLNQSEIRWLWLACDDYGYPYGDLVKMVLMSMTRVNEVAGALYSEFYDDPDFGTIWEVPADRSKNRKGHLHPCTPQMKRLMQGLPRLRGSSGLLFTTNDRSQFSGFSNAKTYLDKRMLDIARAEGSAAGASPEQTSTISIPRWTLHDLRRTGTTEMAKMKVLPHVCEAVLNHVSGEVSGVAAVYNQYAYINEKYEALCRWHNRIEQFVKGS
ncbi:tyrosine-type recombinase/integrase [Rhizobium rhododendri]|uniref:Site-specific integrase n=1 Tax=Rhizobium rhododendri TaxID=2506430 RepID=A0ABY8ILQ0_9HYPH|nr:site-specific integrase [Rhizobium rhododendri]WFS23935.1 site-specific integrase [Rhizobium rhododendri]